MTFSLLGTTALAGYFRLKLRHGAENPRLYLQAARFLDQAKREWIDNHLQVIYLIVLVAFSRLIQSQPHAGAASTIAAEENPQRLLLTHFFLKVVAGFFINNKHVLLLGTKYYRAAISTYYIHITLYRQALSTQKRLLTTKNILSVSKLQKLSHQNSHFSGQNKEPGGQAPEESWLGGKPSGPDGFLAEGDSQVQDVSMKVRAIINTANFSNLICGTILQRLVCA
jgi:hypothetical protein